MRIGVLSDNHRLIDPAIFPLLHGVDEIWHAGDLVTPDIIAVLRELAPVRVVRGNNDVGKELGQLPENEVFDVLGMRVLLRHIVGTPQRLESAARRVILEERPDLVVMGHSHRVLAEARDGRVFLNPGSCGPRRFSLPRSAGVLDLNADQINFVVTDLDSGTTLVERSFRRSELRDSDRPQTSLPL